MDVGIAAFVVALGAYVVGSIAELHVVSTLRDFHPTAYADAGSPTYTNLLHRNSYNWPWRRYVLLRKFHGAAAVPSKLRLAFEVAFVCTWLRFAGLAIFLVSWVPLFVGRQS